MKGSFTDRLKNKLISSVMATIKILPHESPEWLHQIAHKSHFMDSWIWQRPQSTSSCV